MNGKKTTQLKATSKAKRLVKLHTRELIAERRNIKSLFRERSNAFWNHKKKEIEIKVLNICKNSFNYELSESSADGKISDMKIEAA